MDGVRLREYRPGDWEAMYALDVVCFQPVFRFSRRAMRGFAEARGAITVLAEANEELVGFCIVEMRDGVGYVVTLDVAPEWRRQGLARQLMGEMESRVGGAGGEAITLHVYAGNTGAILFYERAGYGRVGKQTGFYGRGLDALVYVKRLIEAGESG
jgi:ribosomal-protein-alanine N-acetyltransferase